VLGGLLLALLVVVGLYALGYLRWQSLPLVPQARDYLAMQRVEAHASDIRFAAEESEVDPNLLAAIMLVESGGRVDARSSKEALGLFQLRAEAAGDAARALKLPPPLAEELLRDARLNIRLGARHVAWLLRACQGDIERTLVAYNAGYGKIAKLAEEAGSFADWRAEREVSGNSELIGYARRVIAYQARFHERGAFALPPSPSTREPSEGTVADPARSGGREDSAQKEGDGPSQQAQSGDGEAPGSASQEGQTGAEDQETAQGQAHGG
jgi:hypothetical protein